MTEETATTPNTIADNAATFLEKAVQFRIFLHFTSAVLYLAIASQRLLGVSIQNVTLETLGNIGLGTWVLIVFGYIVLMGCLFRIINGCLLYLLRLVANKFIDETKRHPRVVSSHEILEEAYHSKDYEIVKMSEQRARKSVERRQESRELAYLSVAALCLAVSSHLLLPGNAIGDLIRQLLPWFSEKGAVVVELAILAPMLILIGDGVKDDWHRDGDVYHPALRAAIDQRKPRR